ncbi:MAG: DUF1349 domain-containing protein [Planctomycetota bacterium]
MVIVLTSSATLRSRVSAETVASSGSNALGLRDEFTGSPFLRWEVVRPDSTHVSFDKNPGALTITTQRGSIHRNEKSDRLGEGIQAKNIYLINNPVSEDVDFVVTTKIEGFRPTMRFQQAGLILYEDDDNYLKWGYEYNWPAGKGQGYCVLTETDAVSSFRYAEANTNSDEHWLRITKRGGRFEYSYSVDGESFFVAGSVAWGNRTPSRIGILAKNGGSPTATELDVQFDFFEVKLIPASSR